MMMDTKTLSGIIESILFAAGDAVALADIANALQLTTIEVESALHFLEQNALQEGRGIVIMRLNEKVQLKTKEEYAEYIKAVLQPIQSQVLSQAALETLSIIAYCQPVTRGEIEAIRGVKTEYVIASLLAKKLIEIRGKKEVIGKPHLYGTTEDFLRHFGLSSLDELPRKLNATHANAQNNESNGKIGGNLNIMNNYADGTGQKEQTEPFSA
ncbi:MAG: SMC-Scp complex subunit ScpB [Christensenellales bacterium]